MPKKTPVKKVKKYNDAALMVKSDALESRMQARAKKDKLHHNNTKLAIILCVPLFATWVAAHASDKFGDALNENSKLEIALGMYGLVAAATALLAIATSPIYSKEEVDAKFAKKISKLLQNKQLDARLNSELVRLTPVFQNMTKQIAEKNPRIAKTLSTGNIEALDSDKVAQAVRGYLKSNPEDARKFLNLLTVADLPQDVIDFYIAQYIPDTLSFSMAQKLVAKEK